MEAAPRGTGVFYQATPSVGPDGKKIMKLIPVQMVNGRPPPQRSGFVGTLKAPWKGGSSSSVLSSYWPRPLDSSLNIGRSQDSFGVFVTSAAPPTARTPPGSRLPSRITRPAPPSPRSALPRVVYVSPETTIIQSSTAAGPSLQLFTKTAPPPGGGVKTQLTLIPRGSQGPHSPTRWVVEEVDPPLKINLDPHGSPSTTSNGLQPVAATTPADQSWKGGPPADQSWKGGPPADQSWKGGPPADQSWKGGPPADQSWKGGPPADQSWKGGPPADQSWKGGPPADQSWKGGPPADQSWKGGPPADQSWKGGPPADQSWKGGPPADQSWKGGPPADQSWKGGPPADQSWKGGPPADQSWKGGPPADQSWKGGPPADQSWKGGPPADQSWKGGPPADQSWKGGPPADQSWKGGPPADQSWKGGPPADQSWKGGPPADQSWKGGPPADQSWKGGPPADQSWKGGPPADQSWKGGPPADQSWKGGPPADQSWKGGPPADQSWKGGPPADRSLMGVSGPGPASGLDANATASTNINHCLRPLESKGVEPDEVIDLCDDDDYPSRVSSVEEDHVIFVSYSPPKAQTHPPQETSKQNQEMVPVSPEALRAPLVSAKDSPPIVGDCVCPGGSADPPRIGADPGVPPSSSTGEQPENPGPSSDLTPRLLKQLLQLRADVRVCLQRIDDGAPPQHRSSHSSQSAPPHWEQETDRHWCTTRLSLCKGSPSQNNINPLSASPREPPPTSCYNVSLPAETGSLMGFMEPIDHDFLSGDVTPEEADCVESSSSRRMARTRKPTMCLCCSHFPVQPGRKGAPFPPQRCRKTRKNRPAQKHRGAPKQSSCPPSENNPEPWDSPEPWNNPEPWKEPETNGLPFWGSE